MRAKCCFGWTILCWPSRWPPRRPTRCSISRTTAGPKNCALAAPAPNAPATRRSATCSAAALQVAEARLAKTVIRAPFDGVVGLRDVSKGDYVQEGEPLVRLEQTNPIKVDCRIPELFLSEMTPGQILQVMVDALPEQVFDGKVLALDPQVDVNGRALVLRAVISNTSGQLRPGLFTCVEIILEQPRAA